MNTSATRVEYVIFDMDGLLIDSERVYTQATNDILKKYGKEMTWNIKAGLMGMPERQAAEHLLSFFPDLPPEFTIETYLTLRRAGQDALWPTVQPMPGVVKLISHLHRHKIPIAVATGSQRRNYELKSAHLMDTLFGHFEGNIVCADDGLVQPGRGKPHPDIFLATTRKCFELDVGEGEGSERHLTDAQKQARAKCLIFEDAIPGLQAGKRAGGKVIWVPDPNLVALTDAGSQAVSILEKPDQVLESLEQFVPEDWGLPPYDDA